MSSAGPVLYGGVRLTGRPDPMNIQKLDLMPMQCINDMMRYGFAIDREHFWELSVRLEREMGELRTQIIDSIPPEKLDEFMSRAGLDEEDDDSKPLDYNPFNLDSNEQLATLLYDVLNIGAGKQLKMTKGGDRISTGKKQLEQLKHEHAVVQLILSYRERAKLNTTYCRALPRQAKFHPRSDSCPVCELKHKADTWRVHTQILTTRTTTGRLACLPISAEILTKRGWLNYNDVQIGDETLGYNLVKDRMEWTKVIRKHVGKDKLGTVKWRVNKVRFSGIRCTKEHQWIGEGTWIGMRGYIPASNMKTTYCKSVRLKLSGPVLDGGDLLISPIELGLIGWAVTDGHTITTCSGRRALEISLVKTKSVDSLRNLLELNDIFFTYSRYDYDCKKNTDYRWKHRFYIGVDVWEPIAAKWLDHYTLTELALRSSLEAREEMFECMMEADGSRCRSDERFGAIKPPVIDCFMALAQTLGRRLSFSTRESGFVDMHIPQSGHVAANTPRFFLDENSEEEDVWCPETDLGSWITRCDGQVVLTGNSKAPNLQNVSTRTELGRLVRAGFVASPGTELVSVDFSQQEIRILAHYTQDPNLLRIYHTPGADVHIDTARRAFGLRDDEMPDKLTQRDPSKTTTFLVVYSGSALALFDTLVTNFAMAGIVRPAWLTLEWCEGFIDRFINELYPTIPAYWDNQDYRARRYGIVWTWCGRVRRVPEVQSVHQRIQSSGLRQCRNVAIQGSGADMTKLAIAECNDLVYRQLRRENIWCWPLITVHDELIPEVQEGYGDMVRQQMEYVFGETMRDRETGEYMCRVPIEASGKVMDRWTK